MDKLDHIDKLGLSHRVMEMTLISAVLSGKLDQSILISTSGKVFILYPVEVHIVTT